MIFLAPIMVIARMLLCTLRLGCADHQVSRSCSLGRHSTSSLARCSLTLYCAEFQASRSRIKGRSMAKDAVLAHSLALVQWITHSRTTQQTTQSMLGPMTTHQHLGTPTRLRLTPSTKRLKSPKTLAATGGASKAAYYGAKKPVTHTG